MAMVIHEIITSITQRLAAHSLIGAQVVSDGTSLSSCQCHRSPIICQTPPSSSATRSTIMARQVTIIKLLIKISSRVSTLAILTRVSSNSSSSRYPFSSIYSCFNRSTSHHCHHLEEAQEEVQASTFHIHRRSNRVARQAIYKSVAKEVLSIRRAYKRTYPSTITLILFLFRSMPRS